MCACVRCARRATDITFVHSADKAKQEKELEKQQELSRIQMNKELNEVSPRVISSPRCR